MSQGNAANLQPLDTDGTLAANSDGLIATQKAVKTFARPAYTGDVTSIAGYTALTIVNDAVTYAKMQNVAATSRVLGRITAGAGDVEELTAANLKTILALASSDVSGLAAIATSGSATDLSGGTLPAGRFPALTGDATTSAGALAVTIPAGTVTLAKQANLAANSIQGNNTGSPAAPLALTAAQVKTLLAIASTDVSGLAAVATSGSATDLSAGTVPAARMPAHTGDVTTSAGAVATTIAAGAVTLAKQANLAANSLQGNNTGSPATPLALTAAQVKTLLAIASTDVSGLAAVATSGSATDLSAGTLPAGRFPALTGDATTSAGALAVTIPAGTVTLAKQANLAANSIQGNNTGSPATPLALTVAQVKTLLAVSLTSDVAGTLQAAQEPAHTGDVTNSAGSLALTIAAASVTLAKQANLAANSIQGNNTGSPATPLALTVAQVKTLLAIASTDVSGLAAVATSGSATDLSAGTLPAGRFPALTGDVTTAAGALASTIAAASVTLAKQANLAANSIIGNNTGSPATPLALTTAQVKTLLAVTLTSDVSGTLQAAQVPAFTGDVTTAAGALATTIAAGAVTLAKQANLAANSIIGNNTGSPAAPLALTAAQVKTLLAVSLTSDVAGTLQAAQVPAFTGDVTTAAGALATTIAAGAVTLAKQANLAANSIQGNNTGSPAAPLALTAAQVKTLLAVSLTTDVAGVLQAAQEPAHTGDVTNSAGSLALTIAAGAVTLAKQANLAATSIQGNNTGSPAAPLALTVPQVKTMLSAPLYNQSTALQAPVASTRTYLAGSAISIPAGKLQVGSWFRWRFNMTKTAAGVAASTIDVAVGTNGTTGDTARVSFTKPAGTNVVDEAWCEVMVTCRGPLSASGVFVGEFVMGHNLQITGHATVPCVVVNTISGTFDVTVANLIVGLCITTGAADAITIQMMQAEAGNL